MARHLDDNKRNQSLDNLAWGSQKDNMQDALRNGIFPLGIKNGISRLTEEEVLEIRKTCQPRSHKFGQASMARKFGVNQSTIHHIMHRMTWYHLP